MTEPKCGETQADESFLGGAAANLLLDAVRLISNRFLLLDNDVAHCKNLEQSSDFIGLFSF